MSNNSFKQLYEEAEKRHDYWMAVMEIDIMERVCRSRILKDHRKLIGNIVGKSFDVVRVRKNESRKDR